MGSIRNVLDSIGLTNLLRFGVAAVAVAAAPAFADPAIKNGGFETVTATGSTEFGTLYAGQVVTDWTTSGYNFLFLPNTADTTGAAGQYGNLQLWGPGNGSNNGLTSSPSGGNFLAADGAFSQAPIQQTITGLSPNSIANVTFYYAGAQQKGFNGTTTEAWQVMLGDQTLMTPVLNNTEHGFTGWQPITLSFIVTKSTEVLSFLAIGTPAGTPPFTLLDGVTISQVPEPTSLALMGATVAVAGLVMRRRGGRAAA